MNKMCKHYGVSRCRLYVHQENIEVLGWSTKHKDKRTGQWIKMHYYEDHGMNNTADFADSTRWNVDKHSPRIRGFYVHHE